MIVHLIKFIFTGIVWDFKFYTAVQPRRQLWTLLEFTAIIFQKILVAYHQDTYVLLLNACADLFHLKYFLRELYHISTLWVFIYILELITEPNVRKPYIFSSLYIYSTRTIALSFVKLLAPMPHKR
jgi:hypothetical protein